MFKLIKLSTQTIEQLSQREGYKPKKSCNGCGSGWNAKIVPDTIFFLDITPICCRHDDRYEHGFNRRAKNKADKEMLENMLTAISQMDDKWWYPSKLARNRAMTYYSFVRDHGDEAFFTKEKKNLKKGGKLR